MFLQHVALYAEDLEALRSFYTGQLGAVSNEKYHNPRTGLETYFLHFGTGASIEIMAKPGVGPRGEAAEHLGLVHLAFGLESDAAVDAMCAKLQAAGCRHVSGPRVTGDGHYEACVQDPEGNLLEFVSAG